MEVDFRGPVGIDNCFQHNTIADVDAGLQDVHVLILSRDFDAMFFRYSAINEAPVFQALITLYGSAIRLVILNAVFPPFFSVLSAFQDRIIDRICIKMRT